MKIPFPLAIAYGVIGLLPFCAAAQNQPTPLPAATAAGPLTLPSEAHDLLKMLQDRKQTLKDFTGMIDYNVEGGRTGDAAGKRGTVDFIDDPTKGPTFSADFTADTEDGKPKRLHHVQFIFDGRDFTVKDYGTNNSSKQFIRTTALPAGAKPGDAVTLQGPVTLPIGLNVEDVMHTFDVTVQPSKKPDEAVLRLTPREKGKFDYAQLEVTIDKRPAVQLPITLVETANNGDVTTITLTDLKINTGVAKLADSATPASEGWTPRAGDSGGAAAPPAQTLPISRP